MNSIRIAIAVNKGGVGKSTLSNNLAGYLAKEHKLRVLVIDTDAQSSTSKSFMMPADTDALDKEQTIACLFDPSCGVDRAKMVHKTHIENLYYIPATQHLDPHDLPCPETTGDQQFLIRNFVDEIEGYFDFIIYDTSPKLRLLPTWNCLMAADFVFSPLTMDKYSLEGIPDLNQFIAEAQQPNPDLHFLGFVVNMLDKRAKLDAKYEADLRKLYGEQVFLNVLTRRSAFREAQALRLPITHYPEAGEAVKIFKALAREIAAQIQKHLETKPANDERKVA